MRGSRGNPDIWVSPDITAEHLLFIMGDLDLSFMGLGGMRIYSHPKLP
jgi:hypothetical protein